MKKVAITIAALLSFASSVQAQLHSHNPTVFGVKAGGTASTFSNNENPASRYIFGGHGGLFANFGLLRPFSVQPEVLYSMKGVSSEPINGSALTLRTAYIDVPVAFRANARSLFAEAGPQVGFLISAKTDYAGTTTDVAPVINALDLGFLLGAGYHPQLGGLGFGVRYNGSLNRAVRKGNSVSTFGTNYPFSAGVRNSAFQAYLSFSPNKGKGKKKY